MDFFAYLETAKYFNGWKAKIWTKEPQDIDDPRVKVVVGAALL